MERWPQDISSRNAHHYSEPSQERKPASRSESPNLSSTEKVGREYRVLRLSDLQAAVINCPSETVWWNLPSDVETISTASYTRDVNHVFDLLFTNIKRSSLLELLPRLNSNWLTHITIKDLD